MPIIHASLGVQNVSIFQYTRVSATSLCTILYEIPEMVIAGDILRHKDISVAHDIWFVCSKLPIVQQIDVETVGFTVKASNLTER